MARAHITDKADRKSRARRYLGPLILSANASLLLACGGGGGSSEPGGVGGAVACTTGPAPVVLSWDPVSDPDLAGYRIYYGIDRGTYLQPRGEGDPVTANVTTYTVMGLTSATKYYFAATAYDGRLSFESDFSNEVCITIS